MVPFLRKAPLTKKEQRRIFAAITGTFLYAILVLYAARFHEPWFDEAQAWLLVRDLSLWDLLAHYLRYEGHPSLWYLLLWLPVHMGLPYRFFALIPVTVAVATVWLVLRYAPFPPFINWMIPFGYFFVFQYAVIARNYVLIPFLLSALAVLYRNRMNRPILFLLLITLLMHVSLHGAVMAAGFALAEFINAAWWPEGGGVRHRRFSRWFLLVVALNGLLLFVQLSFPAGLIYMIGPPEKNLFQIVNYSITGVWGFSLVFLLLIFLWLIFRKAVLLFFFPFVGLLMLFSRVYKIWHGGLLFLLLIFVLWVSYPAGEEESFAASKLLRRFRVVFLAVFGCILSVHMIWGADAVRYDLENSFSGSKSCAAALKKAGLDQGDLYMIGYNTVGVQPYFDRNIFINNPTPGDGAFWFWSVKNPLALEMTESGKSEKEIDKLNTISPSYVLVGVFDRESRGLLEEILKRTDYRILKSFNGTIGWKGEPYQPDKLVLLSREKNQTP